MTYFVRNGNMFNVAPKEALDLHDTLPAGTYTVKYNEMKDIYYLEIIDGFEVKGKIYGDTTKQADRILNTFSERPGSTGVMLSGEKGSGKTLLAKVLSVEGLTRGIPTIVINQPWKGETFNSFMQTIEQETIVIFDEFEKVYDREDQEKMLTLLDGVYPSKKLYILTCNDKWRVNEHMRNRPGRIYYRIDYSGLDTDFITEYCLDNLDNKEHIADMCKVSIMFPEFNFDILKAMVEEMNRYNETPQQVMKVLNAKPEFSDSATYTVTLYVNGTALPDTYLEQSTWKGNPLNSTIHLYYKHPSKKSMAASGAAVAKATSDDDDSDGNWKSVRFTANDIQKVDTNTGTFHLQNKMGLQLTLVKEKTEGFNMWGAF